MCQNFLRISYLVDFMAVECLAESFLESIKEITGKLTILNEVQCDYKLKSNNANQAIASGGEKNFEENELEDENGEPIFEEMDNI